MLNYSTLQEQWSPERGMYAFMSIIVSWYIVALLSPTHLSAMTYFAWFIPALFILEVLILIGIANTSRPFVEASRH